MPHFGPCAVIPVKEEKVAEQNLKENKACKTEQERNSNLIQCDKTRHLFSMTTSNIFSRDTDSLTATIKSFTQSIRDDSNTNAIFPSILHFIILIQINSWI